MKKHFLQMMLIVLCVFLLVPLALSAHAETIVIPASAFLPKDHNVTYSTDGYLIQNVGGDPQEFFAPVILPSHAVVTGMSLFAYDNHAGIDQDHGMVRIEFVKSLYQYAFDPIVSIQTDGPGIGGNTVVNSDSLEIPVSDYPCWLRATIDYARLYSVRIHYALESLVLSRTPSP